VENRVEEAAEGSSKSSEEMLYQLHSAASNPARMLGRSAHELASRVIHVRGHCLISGLKASASGGLLGKSECNFMWDVYSR